MIAVKNIVKTYRTKGGVITKALDNVSLEFPETGMVFLLGKSGSGKSTLLNMIGGLDRPDSGEIIVKGKSSKNFSTSDFDSYRNTFIGFVFQEYNILNEFNVEQNIALALQLQGKKAKRQDVAKILKEVDLTGLEKRKPNTLSGGQKQRIAIARALIKEPQLIMADEPTGALDSNTGKQVFDTLKKLSKTKLVIVVSHDNDFAQLYGDRIIELKDGKVISDTSKVCKTPSKVSDNVNLISENVIHIKDAKNLSAKDNKAILEMIKKQNGEIIISSGSYTISNVKKSLNINDNGMSETFDKTSDVPVKEYNGSQTKFIKSKMPFSRAFKIGASGLKVKPLRLIMTILLSTISFTMFGVVSTLMFYDANYSVKESMRNVDYIAETISKNYYYNQQEIRLNYKTGSSSINYERKGTGLTKFGSQELNDLNKSHSNFEFAGMFNFTGNNSSSVEFKIENASVTGIMKDYFPYDNFNGFSDCGDEYLKKYFSIEKNKDGSDCGYYPTDVDEVAISNYIASDLLYSSFATTDMKSYEDLLGSKIKILNSSAYKPFTLELTISGVYHIGDIPSTYDPLKSEKLPAVSTEERSALLSKYKNFLNGGFFRTAFVNDKFYEHYKSYVEEDVYINMPNVQANYLLFGSTYISANNVIPEHGTSLSPFDVSKNLPTIKFYDISDGLPVEPSEVSLDKLDIIVSKDDYEYFRLTPIGDYGALNEAYKSFNYNEDYDYRIYLNDDEKKECNDINENYYPHYSDVIYNTKEKDAEFYEAYEKILDFINKYFQRCNERNFMRTYAYNSFYLEIINNESKYVDIIKDQDWDYINGIYNRMFNDDDEKLKDDEWQKLTAFTKKYIESVGPYKNQIYYFIGNNLQNKAIWQYNELLGENKYYELINKLSIGEINSDEIERFKSFTNIIYKEIYGNDKEINFSNVDSYYPDFKFDDNYNWKYFFRGTSSSGEMIPKYYYTYSNFLYGSPIAAREFLIDFVADESYIWINNIVTNYEEPLDAKYNFLMVPSNYTDVQIETMMQKHDTYHYEMTNATYVEISMVIDLINEFKRIFFYVGLATGILASLLLANFISASINNKKKDIGILRAVGAKSGDVFKVFWSESGIIALICFSLATIFAAITCASLNNSIASTLISIKVLNFNPLNILIILGVAVLVSFLATLIPVLIAAKKPPVEAIRSL